MTMFWSLAAAMSLLALLFVVTPLLHRRTTREIDRDALNAEVARARLAELDGREQVARQPRVGDRREHEHDERDGRERRRSAKGAEGVSQVSVHG